MCIPADRDNELFQTLRNAGVLQPLNDHLLEKKALIVTCADGHQMPDLFNHHLKSCTRDDLDELLLHTIALNGGALLIPCDSPLVDQRDREDRVILRHLRKAIELKSTPTSPVEQIVLYAHGPCGAAGLANLDLTGVLMLLMKAKLRLRKAFSEIDNISCFFHYDNAVTKRTYFVSKDKWIEWIHTIGNEALACVWNEYVRKLELAVEKYWYAIKKDQK
jgi:carbonic anhydrase